MSDNLQFIPNKADIDYSKPTRSRFYFLLFFFGFFVYLTGCFMALNSHRFQKPNVEVPASTLYNPEYK